RRRAVPPRRPGAGRAGRRTGGRVDVAAPGRPPPGAVSSGTAPDGRRVPGPRGDRAAGRRRGRRAEGPGPRPAGGPDAPDARLPLGPPVGPGAAGGRVRPLSPRRATR